MREMASNQKRKERRGENVKNKKKKGGGKVKESVSERASERFETDPTEIRTEGSQREGNKKMKKSREPERKRKRKRECRSRAMG